ncbi:somatoliberin [Phoenicopterus ruber ruber]
MLDKATLLLFLHLVACSISSPLYPALRYSPGPVAGKAVNFQLQHSSPLQSHNPSAEEQEEEGLLTDPTEKRMQRHADAIFTDNYRKFLGQISARKFLQTIIGKRLGSSESSPGEGVHGFLTRRESDSILMDSRYHQQMVLRDFLGAILQNQRPQDINSSRLEGFPSTLAKLIIIQSSWI